jgi:uncharacterized membrane protein YgaE (UPF0421/DUF939 family)
MKLIGIVLALAGWLLPVLGLSMSGSNGVRLFLCILGIAISLTGILYFLNKAHQKEAVWRR